ncbi:PilZ domain-containing protein [Aggregicoccus sp. 17bor-14]|uniref:PilZ domain-containing protein n=1 Tax=Myxococcaceae TaxID=31 RepID=UPI00351A1C64
MSPSDTPPDRRRFPRLQAPVYSRPARLSFAAKNKVLDVSLGGARIYSDEKQSDGAELVLDLFLPDGTSMECKARVVWTVTLPADAPARYEVGLAFTDVPADAGHRLEAVLVHED